MIPWIHLDTAAVPGGGGELKLMQRGTEFAIMAGATPLMNSRMSSSEIVLAEVACERLRGRRNVRVLIGGYGMGFTLRAALAGLGGDAQVIVAELVPAVLAWARGPMAELTAGGLSDRRVTVLDRRDQLTNAAKYTSTQAIGGDVAEEALYHVEPRGRRRPEVNMEARMLPQPLHDRGMLVRRVVVADQVQRFVLGRFPIDLA